ncbi:4-(cytidine 5'-diphospho)-2-C-methyl-D-erythritol kinase [Candidatus Pseudothioglobus singularis]|nr:4-(cytidine 5'-diphospho)-2-C-methyl-D-erythritol kinase [Candidatus Pseudothioglobus singularis]MDB4822012.1 4-(cytidine 5'-diphospho)-2-C-methyl-D-erythritol kinase [Candidatus Pseudothioglobus singularis]
MTYLSPAKINLFLHINSKRDDGYHNLQTIFQLLGFYDEINFSVREDGKINRTLGNEDIPLANDLMIKSAKKLQKLSGVNLGVDIRIKKKIPSGGGLGGGSSNAATTLMALNHLWGLELTKQKLIDIGKGIGADVPVFIEGQSSWAEGIGEILYPLNLPKYFYLVVSINKHVSTQEIFSHKALTMTPVQRKMSDFSLVSNPHNDCLDAAIDLEGGIKDALRHLDSTQNNIDIARMTGSGSCVFVAFENESDALIAKKELPSKWIGFVAKAIDKSPLYNWDVAKR